MEERPLGGEWTGQGDPMDHGHGHLGNRLRLGWGKSRAWKAPRQRLGEQARGDSRAPTPSGPWLSHSSQAPARSFTCFSLHLPARWAVRFGQCPGGQTPCRSPVLASYQQVALRLIASFPWVSVSSSISEVLRDNVVVEGLWSKPPPTPASPRLW